MLHQTAGRPPRCAAACYHSWHATARPLSLPASKLRTHHHMHTPLPDRSAPQPKRRPDLHSGKYSGWPGDSVTTPGIPIRTAGGDSSASAFVPGLTQVHSRTPHTALRRFNIRHDDPEVRRVYQHPRSRRSSGTPGAVEVRGAAAEAQPAPRGPTCTC